MRLSEYVEDHGFFLVGLLLWLLLQGCVLVFLGLPVGIVCLLSVMSAAILCFFLLLAYQRKQKRHKEILAILEKLEQRYLLHEMLPKGATHEEEFYHWLLYLGNKAMLEEISKVQHSHNDYQEYVEQWVHEIKTPIAAMKLCVENQQPECRRPLLQQLERVEHYVEQALFYARSEAVEKDFRIQQVSLSSCIQESLLQCKNLCTQAGISIQIPQEDALVYTDEKWVIFVLNQLIENAVKYRDRENAVLRLRMRKENGQVLLCVTDHGIGIPSNDLPRIFEKGFTGENGRRTHSHATGIGLYLCKKLCDALQIGLYADSGEEGTTMTLVFDA